MHTHLEFKKNGKRKKDPSNPFGSWKVTHFIGFCRNRGGTVYWSMGSLSRITSPRKTDSCSASSCQLPIVPRQAVGLGEPFPLMLGHWLICFCTGLECVVTVHVCCGPAVPGKYCSDADVTYLWFPPSFRPLLHNDHLSVLLFFKRCNNVKWFPCLTTNCQIFTSPGEYKSSCLNMAVCIPSAYDTGLSLF